MFVCVCIFTAAEVRNNKTLLQKICLLCLVGAEPRAGGQSEVECLLEVESVLHWKLEALQAVGCWQRARLGHPVKVVRSW